MSKQPPNYDVDFSWQRRFVPEMKRIIGEHLIGESPVAEDQERNTDLLVLRLEAVRIACRVRRNHHHSIGDRKNEFTIRTGRPSGAKTELAKIVEGWGDYILYAFGSADGNSLFAWVLGDLSVFRLWFMGWLAKHEGTMPGTGQFNRDGSSTFRAFSISDLPSEFIIARKHGGDR